MKKLKENINGGFSPLNSITQSQKVILVSKRLSNYFRGNTSNEIYNLIRAKDIVFEDLFRSLSNENFLILCFMLPKIKESDKTSDITKLYEQIKNSFFSFSLVEVQNHGVEISCDDCNGDGDVRCDWCDDGEVECEECGGDGEDSDGDDCSECNGRGHVSCEECSGDGYSSCYSCHGQGVQTDDNLSQIQVSDFVSIDKSVYNNFELKKKSDVIEYGMIELSLSSNDTINLYEYETDSSEFQDFEERDVLLIGTERGFDCLNRRGKNVELTCFENFS